MKLQDLFISPAGMIIIVIGFGVGFYAGSLVKPALPSFYQIVGVGMFLIFTAIAFWGLYHTVNKKKGN